MNVRTLSIVSVFAVAALGGATSFVEAAVEVPDYHYGMPLDVAKVIRIDEPRAATCEVVRAQITYLNSQGATQRMGFLKLAEACSFE